VFPYLLLALKYYIYILKPEPKHSCEKLDDDDGVESIGGGLDPVGAVGLQRLGRLNTTDGAVVRAPPVLGGSLSRYIFQLLGEDERLSQTRPRGASESGLHEAKPILELQECFVRG
jgi:hypothetical protein